MSRFGPDNLGVYVCSHVFANERPVLLVSHADGDWQFLCGVAHESFDGPHHVGVGHLIGRDSTLEAVADLAIDGTAERATVAGEWVRNA